MVGPAHTSPWSGVQAALIVPYGLQTMRLWQDASTMHYAVTSGSCACLGGQAFVGEEANMLLVARWDDDDAGDGVVAAMVDALLATVAPAANDRFIDVRPLIAEAEQLLMRAGYGGTPWQGNGKAQTMASVHNAEEIVLPDEDDIAIESDEANAHESRAAQIQGMGDRTAEHAHITNGVAECHLQPSGAEHNYHNWEQPPAVDTDCQQRTGDSVAPPELRLSRKHRWRRSGERNRSRKKARSAEVEQLTTVPSWV